MGRSITILTLGGLTGHLGLGQIDSLSGLELLTPLKTSSLILTFDLEDLPIDKHGTKVQGHLFPRSFHVISSEKIVVFSQQISLLDKIV